MKRVAGTFFLSLDETLQRSSDDLLEFFLLYNSKKYEASASRSALLCHTGR